MIKAEPLQQWVFLIVRAVCSVRNPGVDSRVGGRRRGNTRTAYSILQLWSYRILVHTFNGLVHRPSI